MPELLLALGPEDFTEISGVSFSSKEPEQHRIDTLVPGHPYAFDAGRINICGVLQDRETGLYRMWYYAFPKFDGDLGFHARLAYAESRDAIHWEKPELGLVDWCGSSSNNLLPGIPERCSMNGILQEKDGCFIGAVSKIAALTKKDIQNSAIRNEVEDIPMEAFMGIARSQDGLHWTFDGNADRPAICEKLEVARLIRLNTGYLLCGQQMRPWCSCPTYERVVTFFFSRDLKKWEKMPGYYQPSGPWQSHVGIAPVGVFGRTILGLSGRFSDAPELEDQYMEVDLVRSQNGNEWRQVSPERPYLRRGPVGAWTGGAILQAQGYVETEDSSILYFCGSSGGNCPVNSVTWPGYVRFPRNRFGYAALKVGWDLGHRGRRVGSLRSRMVSIRPGEHLYLNCGNFMHPFAQIRTALTNEKGREIPGFELENSIPVREDGLNVIPKWNIAQKNLPSSCQVLVEITGATFRRESPELYAIEIR